MSEKVLLLPHPWAIVRNCSYPSWVQTALAACNKAVEEADTSEIPQEEEPTAAQVAPALKNKCNLCKGQLRCTCYAIAGSPAREPHSPCPEEPAPVHHSLKNS